MSKRHGPNKKNYEETRETFIKIACSEFTTHGYAQASTSRIVSASGMARGSLYYHFGDKAGLFKAVYEHIAYQARDNIVQVPDKPSTAWDAFIKSCHAYMDFCLDEKFRKIMLIESQAAIPYKDRLDILEKTLLGTLRELLQKTMDDGYFKGHHITPLCIFVFGILSETGRSLHFTSDIQAQKEQFSKALEFTLSKIAQS
jgi:AcrR family transcriptional regulator